MNLLRYRNGTFWNVLQELSRTDQRVTAMCRGRNGDILFLERSRGVLRHKRNGIQTLSVPAGLPKFLVISMAETADGNVWLGTRDAGLFSLSSQRRLTFIQALGARKINALLPVGGGTLWI